MNYKNQGLSIILSFWQHSIKGEEEKRKVKGLLSALRFEANKNRWNYKIIAIVSEVNQKKERDNVLLLLKAIPETSVKEYIRKYWYTRVGMVQFKLVKNEGN